MLLKLLKQSGSTPPQLQSQSFKEVPIIIVTMTPSISVLKKKHKKQKTKPQNTKHKTHNTKHKTQNTNKMNNPSTMKKPLQKSLSPLSYPDLTAHCRHLVCKSIQMKHLVAARVEELGNLHYPDDSTDVLSEPWPLRSIGPRISGTTSG
jgi:hypothetical protein